MVRLLDSPALSTTYIKDTYRRGLLHKDTHWVNHQMYLVTWVSTVARMQSQELKKKQLTGLL